jgi:hypothetical protein
MTDPVHEGNICPCCGTEFGYDDDLNVTYEQLRQLWITTGMAWFSRATAPPLGCDPIAQLIEGDVVVEALDSSMDTTNSTDSRFELVA